MFKKLLLSLLVAIPVVAQAEWVEVDRDDEFLILVDPDRVVATSSSLQYAEAWVKHVIHTDKTKDGLSVGVYQMAKLKFKCNTNDYALSALYHYKKTGNRFFSYLAPYDEYEPAAPETIAETITFKVCNYLYGESE